MDILSLLLGCLICCQMIIDNQAASLSAVREVCAEEGGKAVFPWSLTLDPGETINRIEWVQSAPTAKDVLEVDRSGTQTQYNSRASTNGSAFLILANVTAADVGTYRCAVRILGSNVREEEEAELGLKKLPDLNGVTVTVIQQTSTTVTLAWEEVPVNETCDEVITYHIQYAFGSSESWESAGTVSGSAFRNTTLNFTVTGLNTTGSYKFGVRAENSVGVSNRVEASMSISVRGLSMGEIAGIAIGAVTGAVLITTVIGLVCRGKNQSGKRSQDSRSARSQKQTEDEQAETRTAKHQDFPTNEVRIQDSLSKTIHGKTCTLPPLRHDPLPKQKKKKKRKRENEAEKEEV